MSQTNEPLILTDDTFDAEVSETKGTIAVDFWAPWCQPCRALTPTIEALAEKSEGNYRVAKVNVDDNTQVAAKHNVQSIPTVIIFKNGQEIDRLVGVQSLEKYQEAVAGPAGAAACESGA